MKKKTSTKAFRFRIPLEVMMEEATTIARFARDHWTTVRKRGQIVRPGLDLARDATLSAKTSEEIERLAVEVHAAHLAWMAEPRRASRRTARLEAERRIRALSTTCAWWAGLDGSDADRTTVERLRASHVRPRAKSALAAALEDWTRLAQEWRRRLEGLAGFDARMLDSNAAYVDELRATEDSTASDRRRQARDDLLRMLEANVQAVRRAARFVFAGQPEVLRTIASAAERARVVRRSKRRKTS